MIWLLGYSLKLIKREFCMLFNISFASLYDRSNIYPYISEKLFK